MTITTLILAFAFSYTVALILGLLFAKLISKNEKKD